MSSEDFITPSNDNNMVKYGIIVLIDKIYRYYSNIYNKLHKNITCIRNNVC